MGRLVSTAALAALVSGLLFTVVQQLWVLPPLLQAEAVERAREHPTAEHAGTHEDSLDVPRTALTGAANIAIALGFALLLGAAMNLTGRNGWRMGLAWALAGYAVFFLLPSIHLPPELPGSESGPLHPRQLHWAIIVAASAAGLWIAVFSRRGVARLPGLALLVLPLILGVSPSPVPPGLSAEVVQAFSRATYLANAVLWLSLGVSMGYLHRTMRQPTNR
jgi:cobalt transporter subunit CbtA